MSWQVFMPTKHIVKYIISYVPIPKAYKFPHRATMPRLSRAVPWLAHSSAPLRRYSEYNILVTPSILRVKLEYSATGRGIKDVSKIVALFCKLTTWRTIKLELHRKKRKKRNEKKLVGWTSLNKIYIEHINIIKIFSRSKKRNVMQTEYRALSEKIHMYTVRSTTMGTRTVDFEIKAQLFTHNQTV